MEIEIVDKNNKIITNFELETNPFKIGEIITLNISNKNREYWNVEEVEDEYIINSIEHYVRKDYLANGKYNMLFCTTVEVSKNYKEENNKRNITEIYNELYKSQEDIISSPIRFTGVHIEKIKQIFADYGVDVSNKF